MVENRVIPTEVIDLPSKGYFYETTNPLSSGKIELKYMTAKDEDILTSPTLLRSGGVIDKLLQSLVVNKDINYDSLLVGDKNAVLIASRVLAYGKEYPIKIMCNVCGVTNETVVDLTKITEKDLKEPETKNINEFTFTLPSSGIVLTYRFLTNEMERAIALEVERLKKINMEPKDYTTRLKHIIVAVNGDRKQETIRKFVDNEFLARDSQAFRTHYIKITPDVDMSFDFECSACGEAGRREIQIDSTFLWPNT